jgi:hypothetical protein
VKPINKIFYFLLFVLRIKSVSLEGKYALLRPPSLNGFDGSSSSSIQDGKMWNNSYALFPSIIEMPQYLQGLARE